MMSSLENGIIRESNIYGIPFKVDLIPIGKTGRPQIKQQPEYITIHNTGNKKNGADAEMHTNFVDKEIGYISWHFTVGEDIIYQELPITEIGYHAGDGKGKGNRCSIGIELVEIGDWNKIRLNGIKLIVWLMKNVPWLIGDNIKKTIQPHKHWSGKYCPRVILNESGGFDKFVLDVMSNFNNYPVKEVKKVSNTPEWKIAELNMAYDNKIITDKNYWLERIVESDTIRASEILAMLNNMCDILKK